MNMRRLAELAKLSTSAVSLALRDSPKISAATKKRVRALAKRLGYRPDAKVVEMMKRLRQPAELRQSACFGVISFYEDLRPWERSLHLTRIYEGMRKRADQLGYRLEPLWLRAPGMTYQRFRGILEARGIEGLLCFGSPDLDQEFPVEFSRCAIVTLGLSIRTPLHRVISHAHNDTVEALNRLHQLGYRRPGLVLGQYEELRSAHAHSASYLGWCEHRLGLAQTLPILRLDQVEPGPLLHWLTHQRPDAILFVHTHNVLDELKTVLRKNGFRVPEDVGISALSPVLDGSGFSGMQENQALMGTWAVELLVSRIANRDFGIPIYPRIEMVDSLWVNDRSLRETTSTVDYISHRRWPTIRHRFGPVIAPLDAPGSAPRIASEYAVDPSNMNNDSQPRIEIHESRSAMGTAAAKHFQSLVIECLSRKTRCRVIVGCAPSQDEFFASLVKEARAAPALWKRVELFHMDDYVGLKEEDPQSFRSYLRKNFLDKVEIAEFHLIRGEATSATQEAIRYAAMLAEKPIDIIAMGIGENGHVAFNDPPVADFFDPVLVKVVEMDEVCRQQQVNDGCFPDLKSVPRSALTITLPVFARAESLCGVVPGPRKARAVRDALLGPISTACPATVLRTHPRAKLFLDRDAAALYWAEGEGRSQEPGVRR